MVSTDMALKLMDKFFLALTVSFDRVTERLDCKKSSSEVIKAFLSWR